MNQPYFSVTIPVYNRESFIKGCVESCLSQTFTDFEVVVVDDGSLDNTLNVLGQLKDIRLKIVKHSENRGINAARFSGIKNSTGKWIIGLDSDWELLPSGLQRLYNLTYSLDMSIVGIRARQIWDTGFISPPFVPKGPVDYIGRIKYVEMVGGYDVLGCYRREMYDQLVTYPDRLGGDAGFFLDVLNIHQLGLMLYVEDVLCRQYSTALNSVTRGSMKTRVHNLKKFAPDTLWMFEEADRLHGDALKEYGPNQYLNLRRNIAVQCFYMGKKDQGLKMMLSYLRKKPFDYSAWIILCLGLMGQGYVLYGNAIRHFVRNILLSI